jgi:putative transposase
MSKRRSFSASFKAKVAMEALQERQTLSELAVKYQLHPNQITAWKNQLKSSSEEIFSKKRGPSSGLDQAKEAQLYQQIGQLQYELSWLKKKYESA